MAAVLSLAVGVTVAAVSCAAPPAGEPTLVATIGMPDVHGRIRPSARSIRRDGRLFVAALGNDTLARCSDLRAGVLQRTIAGLHEPQGVLFLAERHELYVTNGGSGVCDVFDADTLARRARDRAGRRRRQSALGRPRRVPCTSARAAAPLSLIDPSRSGGRSAASRCRRIRSRSSSSRPDRASSSTFPAPVRSRSSIANAAPVVRHLVARGCARQLSDGARRKARRRLYVGLRQPARARRLRHRRRHPDRDGADRRRRGRSLPSTRATVACTRSAARAGSTSWRRRAASFIVASRRSRPERERALACGCRSRIACFHVAPAAHRTAPGRGSRLRHAALSGTTDRTDADGRTRRSNGGPSGGTLSTSVHCQTPRSRHGQLVSPTTPMEGHR